MAIQSDDGGKKMTVDKSHKMHNHNCTLAKSNVGIRTPFVFYRRNNASLPYVAGFLLRVIQHI